jgi:hypothetical protein
MAMKWILALLVILFAVPALAVYPGDPGFRGCVISNDDGIFQDTDCDRVPDVIDNCPAAPNAGQTDVDSNGIGDLCDLVIDEVKLEPQEPMQGRSVVLTIGLFNNRPYPMRNVVLRAEAPKLGVAANEQVSTIAPGERKVEELLLRIPECAPARFTDFVVIAEYPYAPGQKEVFSNAVRVPVIPNGQCGTDPGADLTVVDIIELQDVLPETGAMYPFTIKNNFPESKAYILTVQGTEEWGNAIIEPGSVIVVPPGGSRQGAIRVFAYPGQEGMKGFVLTVQARDDIKQVLLQADVKLSQMAPSGPQGGQQLLLGVSAFLGILLLIALVLTFMRHKSKQTLHRKLKEAYTDASRKKRKE